MEIGKHCMAPNCNKLDFLPYACDVCQKVYCDEHYRYTQHGCVSPTKDNQVPICPICNMPVPVALNENPNIKMSHHIDNNCKREKGTGKGTTELSLNRCAVCSKSEVAPIKCRHCNQLYCLKHRYQNEHNCEERQKANLVGRFGATKIQTPDFKSLTNKLSLFSSTTTKYSNTKTTPIGDDKIDISKRITLAVQLPRECSSLGFYMFFDKSYKIGKVIDLIAKHSRIQNDNNRVTDDKKLKLYSNSGEEIASSLSIEQAKLSNNDVVILERAEVMNGLVTQAQQKQQSQQSQSQQQQKSQQNSSSKSDCVVS